ncbi:uncharacterized protein LACBIDRAFT_334226 [Laccaria bicolor S238N-H82]|uniref:Predicted protein n=1 Tax=Laccaria bicolor (strain S238N-H82 / ATCC MYA-4686) TaxID=486041 RepID=B0DYI7_LACBS|nr:uncharacterized protein LACBIDRAFT_334226 [Laccaria bicolor S238N-H82]EDR00252.1 predicted protein [Laccaria bicolor S238N-H82]|eukprot:XP_001889004.1 predicted protein [Laccaria bicolor S238N-H82]
MLTTPQDLNLLRFLWSRACLHTPTLHEDAPKNRLQNVPHSCPFSVVPGLFGYPHTPQICHSKPFKKQLRSYEAMVDFIVCLDACFKQKSGKAQGQEPPAPQKHPDTAFVSSEDVKAMEDIVNEIRPEPKSGSKGKKSQDSPLQPQKDENPDLYEKRVKASTQFFSDTGLMALLCRHDRVLWLVNMTSAGEKQHCALVLLERLFNHLPSTARTHLGYISFSCLWPSMGLPAHLSPKKVYRLWTYRWCKSEALGVLDELADLDITEDILREEWAAQLVAQTKPMPYKKLQDHSVSQIKRKEPGIQQLAKKYNELCGELEAMIKKKQAPCGAHAPHPIASDGLFKLDVDDDIWQDVGLDETDLLPGGEIPNWLGDENVRKGIKSMLELDRCNEEERRLSYERSAMQDWLIEEWKCVTMAMKKNISEEVVYQMVLRAEFLACLCNNWQDKTHMIDPHKPMPDSWGPSLEDLMEAPL